MGIEFVKEGNACERCKVQPTQEANKLVHFTKYDIDELLCGNCRVKIERDMNQKCPKCKKKITGVKGDMDLMTGEYKGESYVECRKCYNKRVDDYAKKMKIKKFIISNWKTWLGSSIGIIGLIIAYLAFVAD